MTTYPLRTPIVMEQEPGSAGKTVCDHYLRLLQGFAFSGERSTGCKSERAAPLAAQAEPGNVKLLRVPWNKDLLDELELFPFGRHDDQADALSLALATLARVRPWEVPSSIPNPAHVQDVLDPFKNRRGSAQDALDPYQSSRSSQHRLSPRGRAW